MPSCAPSCNYICAAPKAIGDGEWQSRSSRPIQAAKESQQAPAYTPPIWMGSSCPSPVKRRVRFTWPSASPFVCVPCCATVDISSCAAGANCKGGTCGAHHQGGRAYSATRWQSMAIPAHSSTVSSAPPHARPRAHARYCPQSILR